MLFELVAPSRIASVTMLSRDPNLSAHHRAASRLPANRGEVEEIIATRPDLVITGDNTSALAVRLLERMAVPVLRFAHAEDFATYRDNLRRLAAALGVPARADRIIASLDAALAAAEAARPVHAPRALVYQPNGYVPGRHTLLASLLAAAGWRNLALERQFEYGAFLALEEVLVLDPDVILFSARRATQPSLAEQQLTHPALRAWLDRNGPDSGMRIPEAGWTCAGLHNRAVLSRLATVGR